MCAGLSLGGHRRSSLHPVHLVKRSTPHDRDVWLPEIVFLSWLHVSTSLLHPRAYFVEQASNGEVCQRFGYPPAPSVSCAITSDVSNAPARRVVFRRPGMAYIFCNIHKTISAVVAVLPTPYFALTSPDGRFEIRAPAGVYRLQVWHERSVAEKRQELERRVTLGDGSLDAGEITVSEKGYVAQRHKNKFGQEYSPAPEEAFFYPGGRR